MTDISSPTKTIAKAKHLCSVCRKVIQPGAEIIFWPSVRETLCLKCGGDEYADLQRLYRQQRAEALQY